jgi:hypothetical protein
LFSDWAVSNLIYYLAICSVSLGIYWFLTLVALSTLALIESYHTVSQCGNWMLFVFGATNLVFMIYWVMSLAAGSESLSPFAIAMCLMGVTYVYVTIMHAECFDVVLVESVIAQICTEICYLCGLYIYDRCLKHRFFGDDLV